MRRGSTFAFLLLPLTSLGLSLTASAQLAVQGDTIYTMSGPPIRDGVVLIRSNKVETVGRSDAIAIPDGYRILKAKIVTPGLIDAHTVVGLSGILNQPHDQEQLEKSAPIQPELRAVDSYNQRDPLVEYVRQFGVTTIHTGHGPGALISGQTMIIKTLTNQLEAALMIPSALIAATLGDSATTGADKPPGTRAKAIAMLRTELIKAREYAAKRARGDEEKRPARDLRLEELVSLLDGRKPLLVTVHRHHDILALLRLAAEFKLRVILDDVPEAYLVLDEIKGSGFPIILHPTMQRASGESENLSYETAALLKKAGILFALQSGFESYVPKTRVVLFEAALAASHGLTREEALASITIDAARLLGISDRVGSLEPGKDGDLALYDGDPFEYTTHCVGVVIFGQVVSVENK